MIDNSNEAETIFKSIRELQAKIEKNDSDIEYLRGNNDFDTNGRRQSESRE